MDKFEEIKNFKELLDNGIITQDEFDKKKQELLEGKDSSSVKAVSSFFDSAKEKSEQAKAAAAEKLEVLKKKQAEEAEKRKAEEEERKKKEAEQAKIAAEQKQKAAEEKRLLDEEKRKQKEEKKQQAKQQRKEFFSKKSVKVGIGVVCAIIVAFIGLCVYGYVNRDTIKDDFSDTNTQKIHDLECTVPSNWIADTQNIAKPYNSALESKAFIRHEKNSQNILAGLIYQYCGDDINIDDLISDIIDSDWEKFTLQGVPNYVKAYRKDTDKNHQFYTFAYSDYSAFVNYLEVADTAYDEETVKSILSAPNYSSYKNKAEVEDISVKYNGSNEDGYTASKQDFDVSIKYKNKEAKKVDTFELSPSAPVINSGKTTNVKVKCHGIEKDVELRGKQVEKIIVKYSGDTEAGTVIKKGDEDLQVKIKWDDGSEEVINDYKLDKEIKLKAGETGEATVSAFGKSTKLKVECTTLTPAQYKEKCTTRNYKELLRNYSFDKFTKIYGKVVQDCGASHYRITSGGSRWDDVYMVTVLSDDKLVEDDWVTCYGYMAGIYEYTTVMGASQKVPWLMAEYVELD